MDKKPDVILWSDMPNDIQETVLNSFTRHFRTSNKEALRQAFNEGNPILIYGFENKKLYTQIHPVNSAVMEIIIKQKLQK